MTLILLNIYDQHQNIVGLIFKNTKNDYFIIVPTEKTSDEQISTFIYTPGLSQHTTIKSLFQSPRKNFPKILDENSKWHISQSM